MKKLKIYGKDEQDSTNFSDVERNEHRTSIVLGSKGSGKTIRMIKWLKEDQGRILSVLTSRTKDDIVRNFKLSQEDADRIISHYDLEKRLKLKGRIVTGLAIDDLEAFLLSATGYPVSVLSLSVPMFPREAVFIDNEGSIIKE